MAQQTALEKYKEQQAQIKKLLNQIETGLKEHNRKAGDTGGIRWGHVGDLNDIAATLADLKDRLHNTGEYAEVVKTW